MVEKSLLSRQHKRKSTALQNSASSVGSGFSVKTRRKHIARSMPMI